MLHCKSKVTDNMALQTPPKRHIIWKGGEYIEISIKWPEIFIVFAMSGCCASYMQRGGILSEEVWKTKNARCNQTATTWAV